MDLTNRAVWLSICPLIIAAIITSIARRRIKSEALFRGPFPPLVNFIALIGVVPTLFRKGLQDTIQHLYMKFGSVFTINFFGIKVTFLVGPEVTTHFFQGLESEISHGNMFEFTVPMFGKEVGYAVDFATRNDQKCLFIDALKPSKLRFHVDPMVQEVEDYFSKWGHDGIVDLRKEMEHLLMLISSRCLLGREVREKMFDEVFQHFSDLSNGLHFFNILFPYIPIPRNRQRDKARVELTKIFSEIARARKRSNQIEEDVLQSLIDSKNKDGCPITEGEVAGLIMTLIFAGKHSSFIASIWTAAFLLKHVEFLMVVLEEQNKIIRKYGNHISYDILLEMTSLHSCIKEALRIHPGAKINIRKVHKNFTICTKQGNKYEILEGHVLVNPTEFNNNLPYIYKDPHVYDPDRFGPGREEDKIGGRFSYTSFGGGRNACIGEAFAYMQIKVIFSHLLRNFHLKLVSPFPHTQPWKLVSEPVGKVMVSYKRRHMSSI